MSGPSSIQGPLSLRGLDSGPSSLLSDNEFGPGSLVTAPVPASLPGVKFAFSALESALPAIVDEVALLLFCVPGRARRLECWDTGFFKHRHTFIHTCPPLTAWVPACFQNENNSCRTLIVV